MSSATDMAGAAAGRMEGRTVILRPKNLTPGLKPEYVIEHLPATIGRHPVNDIELPSDSVSRYHARLELHEGRLRLVDLRSSNGTFVNGKRVQMASLADNDALAFGSLDFTLSLDEPRDAPSEESRSGCTRTSVHFTQDEPVQTIYHTELPEDDASHTAIIQDEITDPQALKKARHRLMTLYRLQDVLRATCDEARLLESVLALLFEVLPVDRGAMLTRDEQDAAVFRPTALKVKTGIACAQIGISKTILQRCLKEKVAVLTRDASLDHRFSAADSVVSSQMRSVMCVPLISAKHVFGFCHLDTTDSIRAFSEDDLTFLAHVCQELAIRLHHLRMVRERIANERMAAIGQTITGMAHNIKNILVLSQGGVEVMEKRLNDRNYDALDETWLIVRRGVERINKLVQEMLDYSRARKVEPRRTDLRELLEDLRQTFAEELARRRIECRLVCDEQIPPLMLDADGLEKVLANLVVNAMEAYEERKGWIELRLRKADEGSLALEVEDQAGGIPSEVLPRIFVPFFTTKGSKGSGLGLAMTKKLVEDMGGYIEVKTREGAGTCFTIMLQVGPSSPRLAEA